MERILEPEVMETLEAAIAYDTMDFTEVNTAFADQAIAIGPEAGLILDAGTGPARIPILLCQRRPGWQVVGIDWSRTMLQVGAQNVEQAGLNAQITLEWMDAKHLLYGDTQFDMVVSNSLIHHLAEPLLFLQELRRVIKPTGAIFLRDLLRPADAATVEHLVQQYGTPCDSYQTQLFRDSLYAALRLEEVSDLLSQAGLQDLRLYQSSDRHWTAEGRC